MSGTPPTSPPEAPWPPPWARTVGFVVGMAMMLWEAYAEHSAHLFVYGIGFLLTGLPIARGLDKIIDFLSNLSGKK